MAAGQLPRKHGYGFARIGHYLHGNRQQWYLYIHTNFCGNYCAYAYGYSHCFAKHGVQRNSGNTYCKRRGVLYMDAR